MKSTMMLLELLNGIRSPIVRKIYTFQQNERVPVNLETGIGSVMESALVG